MFQNSFVVWVTNTPLRACVRVCVCVDSSLQCNDNITWYMLQWWPATLVRQLEDTEDGEGRLACLIRYDADTTNGYDEPEEREVTFIGEHELWDLEEEEILVWRKEGDGWECESEAEQANGTEDGTVDILSLYREEERKMRYLIDTLHQILCINGVQYNIIRDLH